MPHDANGNLLTQEDIVNIPCKIRRIHQGEEYCNIDVETVYPMYPGENKNYFALNTKQVVKDDNNVKREARATKEG